jgi:hypothetical protein
MQSSSFRSLALAGLCVALGCDTTTPKRDAAPQSGQRVSEVSVRLEAPNGGVPSVSVLAFKAAVTGRSSEDVLFVVDPLVASAPEGGCLLRDVAGASRTLGDRGGKVELDALAGLTVDLGPGAPYLRPSPRVFPDLAAVVGGVVGEAGPVDVLEMPSTLGVTDTANVREVLHVPGLPRVLGHDGLELPQNAVFPLGTDLVLDVVGPASWPAHTFIELRPYGATWALACPVTADKVAVPANLLAQLMDLSGRVPVSLEAVSRESRLGTLGGGQVHLSLEVRSSSVVELRP